MGAVLTLRYPNDWRVYWRRSDPHWFRYEHEQLDARSSSGRHRAFHRLLYRGRRHQTNNAATAKETSHQIR